ncbi:MAG: AgmX/PglI C-terminal domain-containing protein [Myxococcota bacterium]
MRPMHPIRPMRTSRSAWTAWLIPVSALALGACGGKGEAPRPDAAPVATAAADATPADVPPAKPSRLPDGEAFMKKELAPDGVTAALELADALAGEDVPAAKIQAARVRLAAVARALEADPSGASLGEGGAEKQLRLVLQAGELGGDGKAPADAARALLSFAGAPDAGAKVKDVREMLDDATPEGQALRLVALGTLARALDAGSDAPGFETLARRAGPLLCDGCADAARLTPDQLRAIAEKPAADGTGFACAPGNAKPLGSPCDALTALAPVQAANAGGNVLALAALQLEEDLRALPPGPPPLGAALKAALEKIPKRSGYALPQVVADLGQGALGATGLAPEVPALAVAVIGPSDIKMGARPVVTAGGQLVKSGQDLADAPATALADIAEAQPDPATGAIAVLADRAKAVAAAVLEATTNRPAPRFTVKGVDLAILPGAPAKAVVATADALRAAGFDAFAVMRPQAIGASLPLYLRSAPAEIEAPLVATWEKPILVVVTKDAIDVWGPEKVKDGGAAVGADRQAEVPTSAQPGWRGETLARLRVPIPPPAPEQPRIGPATLQDAKTAIDFWQAKTKVGPVVHVVAGDGADAWDVLAVAHAVQEAPKKDAAPALVVATTWPGARCPGEASDCASAMVVAFSGLAVPSERGLSDKPKKGEKKEEKPPTPPPSDEFCNKADIQTQMRKRAGTFRFCYEKELQLQKDLEGRLVASFTIDLGGKVKNLGTSGGLPNKAVGECIKGEIKKITFAPPKGGECVVSWPFQFKAN